jgi:hypothetical protein
MEGGEILEVLIDLCRGYFWKWLWMCVSCCTWKLLRLCVLLCCCWQWLWTYVHVLLLRYFCDENYDSLLWRSMNIFRRTVRGHEWLLYVPCRKKANWVVSFLFNWTRHMGWCSVVGHLKWKLNLQDAISPERKTWPGRLRHNGQKQQRQHCLGPPEDGSCIGRQPVLTRSVEDARYIHISFRLLADLVLFEQVKVECFFCYCRHSYLSPY